MRVTFAYMFYRHCYDIYRLSMVAKLFTTIDFLITKEDAYDGYFYIKNPRNTYDWTFFFQPLLEEAWIGLIVFTFVTPFLIAMIAFVRKSIHILNIHFLRVGNVRGNRFSSNI